MRLTQRRPSSVLKAKVGVNRGPRRMPSNPRILAVACLIGAAVIHAAQAPPHFQEWGPAGVTFVILAILEGQFAAGMLLRPDQRVVFGAAVVSAGTALLWLVSRTVGIPFGPDAWVRERVGRPDTVATTLEMLTLLALIPLIRHHQTQARSPRAYATVGLIALLVASAAWIGIQPVAGCGGHGASLTGPLVPLDGHSILVRRTPIAQVEPGQTVGLVVALLKNCAADHVHVRSVGLITTTDFNGAVAPVSFWVLPPGIAIPGRPVPLPDLLAHGARLPGNARVQPFGRSKPMPVLVLLVRTLKAGGYSVDGLEIRYVLGSHEYRGIYADIARLEVQG